jgi:MipA family protein
VIPALARPWASICLSGLLCALAAPLAHADAAAPVAASAPASDWSVTVGAGVQVEPRYPGASSQSAMPIPAFDIEYKNRWFAKQDMPFGVYAINDAHWSVGLALQYDMDNERHPGDAPRVAALPDLPMTPRAKAFADYTWSALTVSTSVAQDIGGHGEGLIADANAIVTLPLPGGKFYFNIGPGLSWGDRQYQTAFFGVTPAQSAASGLPAYTAHAGIASDYLSTELDWLITQHWIASVNVKLARLQGSAAHSPVVSSRGQTTTTATLSYTF